MKKIFVTSIDGVNVSEREVEYEIVTYWKARVKKDIPLSNGIYYIEASNIKKFFRTDPKDKIITETDTPIASYEPLSGKYITHEQKISFVANDHLEFLGIMQLVDIINMTNDPVQRRKDSKVLEQFHSLEPMEPHVKEFSREWLRMAKQIPLKYTHEGI